MKVIAPEFATNMFGHLKPETKERLYKVIANPCQETWEDAHSIILSNKGKMPTLWNAVLEIDPSFIRHKKLDSEWPNIPTRETIIKAIDNIVFNYRINHC